MALFNRKKTDSKVLPEVEQYYQAERRDRGWLAWLLAIASVLVVVLIIAGLFFAGRWAYNEITGNDDDVAVNEDEVGNEEENGLTVDGDPTNVSEEDETADEPADSNDGSDDEAATNDDADTEDNEGTVNAPAQTNTPSNQQPTTPATGDDPLPSTGAGSLVGVLAGVSTLAGGIHYVVERRKQR
jgi:cytoskeletal protein RodZ